MATATRNIAIMSARQVLAEDPIFLDTETTGLGTRDQVIEIGIVDNLGDQLYYSLVYPSVPVSEGARAVHGLTMAYLLGQPSWDKIWPDIRAVLRGRRVVAYNATFDMAMISQSCAAAQVERRAGESRWTCTMQLYAQFYGDYDNRRGAFRYQSLARAVQQCGITVEQDHRALGDARLARSIMRYMAQHQPEKVGA